MITRSYHFSESRNEYDVLDIEIRKDGKRFIVNSYEVDWYNGKSSIPSVPRKEK
jgi:hypothetical protein